jgi:hypothetical protein
MGIEFDQNTPFSLDALGSGHLTGSSPTTSAALTMAHSGLFEFNLDADTGTTAEDAIVTMSVTDAAGNVVLTLTAAAGKRPVTAAKYLPAGTYSISFRAKSKSGAALSGVDFWLHGDKFSDPIGPYTSLSSPPNTNATGYTYTGSSTTSTPPRLY